MMKGNSIVWMYAVATLLWFGIANSFSLEDTGKSSLRVPLLIRPVVDGDGVFVEDDEPPVRIAGPNGLCVDVRDGDYANGNPIQLYECKSNSDVNQLWTLKADGTIRSNGKCLTVCSTYPGGYMMIYDCATAARDAKLWEVRKDGTIINPKYGLVLTATSGSSKAGLVLDANINVPAQGWFPKYTRPSVAAIVGIDKYCLTYNKIRFVQYCNHTVADVWVESCTSQNVKQQWSLYPDGSIRPKENNKICLIGDVGVMDGIVRVLDCSIRSVGQRWMMKEDGAIWNLHYQQVLDVKQSDPTLKTVLIYPFTGNSNQKWVFDLIN